MVMMKSPEPTSNPIVEQLREAKWSKEVMAYAVAAKREARAAKGQPFNCFVLALSDPVARKDEFTPFLTKLKENIGQFDNKTRFQLAILTGDHWTACDVQVEKGNIKLFVLDAVGNEDVIGKITRTTQKTFPNY
jgi:hypothetical protein